MSAKKIIKPLAQFLFLLMIFPVYIFYRFLIITNQKTSVFQGFSQALSLIPGKPGIYLRAAFYRLACIETSQNISIGFLTLLSHPDTTIMDGVYIGPQSNIGSCRIGRNTLIGSGVHVLSGKNQHNFSNLDYPIKEQGGMIEKIEIGEDCWIGNCSQILAPVSRKTIVAAGSLVLENLPPEVIIGGSPAKILKSRRQNTTRSESE